MISVIIPVYRAENCLPACLDSVTAQTCADWECILVDDGSPDASGEICDAYAARDSRFRVIHQPNSGVSRARNTGLAAACGEYVAFLDSDDRLTPDCLERLAAAMTADVDLVLCEYNRLTPEGVQLYGSDYRRAFKACRSAALADLSAEELLRLPASDGVLAALWEGNALLSSWGKLYRRSLLESYGAAFDETISYAEDRLFTAIYSAHARGFAVICQPLYLYYCTYGSLSNGYKPGMYRLRYEINEKIRAVFAAVPAPLAAQVTDRMAYFDVSSHLALTDDRKLQLAMLREYCALPNYSQILKQVREKNTRAAYWIYRTRSPRLMRTLLHLMRKHREKLQRKEENRHRC